MDEHGVYRTLTFNVQCVEGNAEWKKKQQKKNSTRCQTCEPPHDKTNKWHVHPAKTQISLGIRRVRSESSLSAWRKLRSLATQWAHSKDSDQTGRMPRQIRVLAGRTATLLVLSWGGSYVATDDSIFYNCRHPRHLFPAQRKIQHLHIS